MNVLHPMRFARGSIRGDSWCLLRKIFSARAYASMEQFPFIPASKVKELLDPKKLIDIIGDALIQFSMREGVQQPVRSTVSVSKHNGLVCARISGKSTNVLAPTVSSASCRPMQKLVTAWELS